MFVDILFVNDCHPVEVVVGKVEMLSCLGLHLMSLNVETAWGFLDVERLLPHEV